MVPEAAERPGGAAFFQVPNTLSDGILPRTIPTEGGLAIEEQQPAFRGLGRSETLRHGGIGGGFTGKRSGDSH
jgi:hypothetical protein